MPIYLLSPLTTGVKHYEWHASPHREPILIRAETERDARDLAKMVCGQSVPKEITRNTCFGPWCNPDLVSCSMDTTTSYTEIGDDEVLEPAEIRAAWLDIRSPS